MTTIYLIRHAEADGNIYRRIHGQYNGLVTPRGYQQLQCLAKRFENINIDAVYASDLFRTLETARAISEPKGLDIIPCPALREIFFGIWEDIPWGDALVNHTDDYMVWENEPFKFKLKNSETYMDIYSRARRQLDSIIDENPNKTVAVVSHGTVIRALLCMISIGNMEKVCDISWCENTGVAKISCNDIGSMNVDYCNDGSHLDSLTTIGRQRWWQDDIDPGISNLHFVRAKLPEDFDRIDAYYHNSWCSLFDESTYSSSFMRARLKKVYAASDDSIVFARQRNGNEVGVAILDPKTQLIPNSGHIMLLYLCENCRGKGYGAQLLGHAVSVYRAAGKNWITVRAADSNKPALRFYEKFGFEEFGAESSDNTIQRLLRKDISATPRDITWK